MNRGTYPAVFVTDGGDPDGQRERDFNSRMDAAFGYMADATAAEQEVLGGDPAWRVGAYKIISSQKVGKFKGEVFTDVVARIRCADGSVREFEGDMDLLVGEAQQEVERALKIEKPKEVLAAEKEVLARIRAERRANEKGVDTL